MTLKWSEKFILSRIFRKIQDWIEANERHVYKTVCE